MTTYVHGLDNESEPGGAELAKRMLDHIGGHWWNVYIGGPNYRGKGWTPEAIQEYVRHGISRFMLTYVGRQKGGTLTHAQGAADGREAVNIAARFGYSGNFPLCLDLEASTYPSNPSATLEYVRAWCATVKAAGARPGIYSNPSTLVALHGKLPCDFVWVASWVSHGKVDRDPRGAPQMPKNLWPALGQRAWQTSGAGSGPPVTVLNHPVDINVADLDCLAHAPGVHAATGPARIRALRRGDRGPRVRQLTKRLSYAHSHATGKPYLGGERPVFGAATEAALKAFQREHGIKPKGVYGVATQHALHRSVELENARRRKVREGFHTQHPVPAPSNGSGGNGTHHAPLDFATLVADVRRLDAETDRAWQLLVAYAGRRERALRRARDEAVSLADIARILIKMENTLEALVTAEEKEAQSATTAAVTYAEPEPEPAPPHAATAVATATVTEPAPAPEPAHAPLKLEDLGDADLLHRVDRYDHAVGVSREVLIARYAEVERKIARLTGHHPVRPGPPGGPSPSPAQPPQPRPRPQPRQPAGKVQPKVGVRKLQAALNKFSQRYLHAMTPIAVDGKNGPETKHRIRQVKFYLGYGSGKNTSAIDQAFLRRLRRPGSPRFSNPAMLTRARNRRQKQRKLSAASHAQHDGTVMIDGHPVASWIAVQVLWARANGWHGQVLSGYRTPEYSEHVCMQMYHRPSVPGRCAGRTSNHVGLVAPFGAVDVSIPEQFAACMRRSSHGPSLCNALPATDPRHFSHNGH